MRTGPPGIKKLEIDGVELWFDGSWWYCVVWKGKTTFDILDQFKKKAQAKEWAENYEN